jgi:hypothetical protein
MKIAKGGIPKKRKYVNIPLSRVSTLNITICQGNKGISNANFILSGGAIGPEDTIR